MPSPTAFIARMPAPLLKPPGRLAVCWAIAAASFVIYILGNTLHGPAGVGLSAIGASACGWAWLLTRALFDPVEREVRWPVAVVLLVTASGAGSVLLSGGGAIPEAVDNLYALLGSAALLLTFIEPLHGWRRDLPATERRFRVAFLAVYSLLVAVSILLLRGGEDEAAIKNACAMTGLLAGGGAVWFRALHPLTRVSRPRPRLATDDDIRLAERIERLLREETVFATPDLKVGDLARRLGEPEYRITQCITGAMGFPNFNRLINHHRIERAKARLAAADNDQSILVIAFDSGFSSLGPFNRAFKEATGLTPRAYRLASRPGRAG